MTYSLTQPLRTAVKVGGYVLGIQFTVYSYTVIVNLIFLLKKFFLEWSALCICVLHESITVHSVQSRKGMEEVDFLGKDDSSESHLYMN